MDAVQREGVGARIKALRLERGWSQAQLAEEAGVSARTVFSVENGEHVSQPAKLRAILDALDVAPEPSVTLPEGMPEDVAVFVRVAAQRLSVLTEDERTAVLMQLYPRLLAEIPRQPDTER